jgi:hypothetical protein
LTTEKQTCTALTKSGVRCRGWPDVSGKCPAHRPNAHEVRVYAGQCRSRQHQLETRLPSRFKPVLDLLANAITETHAGSLRPAAAQGMAALATALIKVTEFSELIQRVEELESQSRLERGDKHGFR